MTDPDEGIRNISVHIANELSKRHEVLNVEIRDIRSWRSVKRFATDIIHFVLSPSNLGLLVAKLLAGYCKDARTVISAPHPDRIRWGRLANLFRPDVTLVQSNESEEMFRDLGYRTLFFPNGVDCERFRPVFEQDKQRLRDKYDIPRDKFVILHVGPLKDARNVQRLAEVQDDDNQVLVVGRPSEQGETRIRQELEEKGCIVWLEYFPELDEIYALSDCYVFPTPPENKRASIEMPLSIMEAMACNLPVITTRFGALPRVFEQGEGFVFVDGEDELIWELDRMKTDSEIGVRDKVLPYTWHNAAVSLEQVYEELLTGAQP